MIRVVLYGLASHAIPNLLYLRTFSEIKIHEAQKTSAAGDLKHAERLLGEVDAFGGRMVNGSETKIEELIGMSLARDANRELAALYTSAGRTVDAQKAELRVQQIDERLRGMRGSGPEFDHERYLREQAYRRRGLLVQGSGGLVVLSGFAALAGILLLDLWPAKFGSRKTAWRRALCWVADYAPATLLVASSAFLVSFLPYAHAFAKYRSSSYAHYDDEHIMEDLWGPICDPGLRIECRCRRFVLVFCCGGVGGACGFYHCAKFIPD